MTRPRDNAALLQMADAGRSVVEIARSWHMTPGRVYTILRRERPDRERTPRRRTSPLPDQIRGLVGSGVAPARAAVLLRVSRQYVHRTLREGI